MTGPIGNWPQNWDMHEVGNASFVKESESDGDSGYRVIPDHLDDVDNDVEAGAVLVEKVTKQKGPGNSVTYWNLAIQSQHGIVGESGKRGYVNRWQETNLSKKKAESKIDDIIDDLESATGLTDLGYIRNNIY